MPSERTNAELPPLIRLFVDGGMDAAVVVDRELRVVYGNPAYVRLTGWRPKEFERNKVPGMCHAVFGLQSCTEGCVSRRVMETGRPIRLDEVKATLKDLRLHVVAIPLLDADGQVWGAVEQYRDVTAESNLQDQYRRMLDQERAQRQLLTQELVQTTARSKEALDKERRLAQTDGLTGLYNRRYFDERIAEHIASALNGGPILALILFDLDHFKNVNDTYGHAKGDETLRTFAEVLRSQAREEDVVARFGGEEFAMLIRGSSTNAAWAVSNRVLEHVRELVQAGTLVTTTSAGIALCPQHATTPDAMIQAADRALYAAKRNGRNQILIAADVKEGA